MAATLVFRREWIVQMNEMIKNDDYNPLQRTAVILRVPTPLLKSKPEAYLPQFLSFGPYHHSNLEKDIDSPCAERKISTAEAFKGKCVAGLSQKLHNCGKSFKSIVEMMKRMRPEIESFYHWPTCTDGEYYENFALMMAIDSSFLLQFLIKTCIRDSLDDEMGTIYSTCIMYDMMKLENQIPLFVLKEIFEYAKEALDLPLDLCRQDFNQLLPMICQFSPFPFEINIGDDEMAREPHYLGCIHASLSLLLHMQAGGGKDNGEKRAPFQKLNGILQELAQWIHRFLPTVPQTECLFPNGMSAVQLARAGIKFKPFSKLSDNIRFDKISGTVYLPPIIVCDIGTEVILRNIVALEFNDALRPKYVTSYVSLMGNLIQSPEDVRILVDLHIISRGCITLTDEGMVKMWNDVRQPFLRGSMTDIYTELLIELANWYAKNYLKNKVKRKVCGLFDYVSSWKFIAPLAGFLGLAMTAIQTYCSLYHC